MFKKLVGSIKEAINPTRVLVNQPAANQPIYPPSQVERPVTTGAGLAYLDFPEVDGKGMKQLRKLDNVRLSGVTKKYEGSDPQDTIESLNIDEEVFFKRIPMKKYPNATLVVDCNDDPIGWIPEDFFYQEDIAKRLDDGTTVKGIVNNILGGDNGKSYGITIDIARYEKKRVPKATK